MGQDYEAHCGCTYSDHAVENTGPGIDFCPLHKAAPELLEAAKGALGMGTLWVDDPDHQLVEFWESLEILQTAIAHATEGAQP